MAAAPAARLESRRRRAVAGLTVLAMLTVLAITAWIDPGAAAGPSGPARSAREASGAAAPRTPSRHDDDPTGRADPERQDVVNRGAAAPPSLVAIRLEGLHAQAPWTATVEVSLQGVEHTSGQRRRAELRVDPDARGEATMELPV